MKISLALSPRRPLDRQKAWGCLTSNLAAPGVGSLIAGRAIGYVQLAIGLVGFVLSAIFAFRFIVWYFTNKTQLEGMDDISAEFHEVWLNVRWALLGVALVGFAELWALATSLAIVNEARKLPPPAT